MGLLTKKILGISISIAPKEKVLEEIEKYFETKDLELRTKNKKLINPLVIFTPNPEIIVYAQKDDIFKQVVNSAQINIADGVGVVWAVKKIYGDKVKRLSGVDLMLDLCDLAGEKGLTIGLIGGREQLALKTAECLVSKYKNLRVEVFQAPEIIMNEKKALSVKREALSLKIKKKQSSNIINTDEYFQALLRELADRKIDIFFVALGFPKQEYFIDKLSSQFAVRSSQLPSKQLVLMAVGGAFDYISGKKSRAPKWMRENGFEWLYRLFKEPQRLPRQLKGAEFFYQVLTSNK